MSHTARALYKKKLRDAVSIADDDSFLQMVWAVDALQSGRAAAATRWLNFDPDAATSSATSNWAIHPWELESLCTLLFTTQKAARNEDLYRVLNCHEFHTAARTVNHLRKLENAESGLYFGKVSVWNDLARIGHRQFHWQRRYFNQAQFYRYAFIFGSAECDEYIRNTHGVSIYDLSKVGFALYSHYSSQPWWNGQLELPELDLSQGTTDAVRRLIALPHKQAPTEVGRLIERCDPGAEIAHLPSILRQKPIIDFERSTKLIAPLPELIIARITAGVYYDLVSGPSGLRNAASEKFEEYVRQYSQAVMPSHEVTASPSYKVKGNTINGPDGLVFREGTVEYAIECKATKLSYAAQFSSDPLSEAKQAFGELAKGIFQIWRFFSHVRRGMVPATRLSEASVGIVVTLDYWLQLNQEVREQLFADATELAKGDTDIIASDRRHVAFCPIGELETIFSFADEDDFRDVVLRSTEPEYRGWDLQAVAQHIVTNRKNRPYPFKISDIVPWWRLMDEVIARRRSTGTAP